MKVLLVNPPLRNLSNRVGVGFHLPLGLLMVGGPIVDDGHDVELLDADALGLSVGQTASRVAASGAHALLVGHSGSTSANPVSLRLMSAVKALCPDVVTVYGGVFPTFAHQDLVADHPFVDVVVRGEGEETARQLIAALDRSKGELGSVAGTTWRSEAGNVIVNPRRPLLVDLDRYRVAWELADWPLYRGFGFPGPMAGVEFSRGCDNVCTYCGQRPFSGRWRHRSVESFIADLRLLHDEHNVRTFWIADDNWGADRGQLVELLTAMAALPFRMEVLCSLCAADVVRDADMMSLYRAAGIRFVLMGVESYDDEVLRRVKKHNPHDVACRAISLLRRHGMLSIANYLYGLRPETIGAMLRTLLRVREADPDYLNALYLCPHGWTLEGRRTRVEDIIQPDQERWNYRCQVLRSPGSSAGRMFVLVKLTEFLIHVRWRWFWRCFFHPDREVRRLLRWCFPRISAVWIMEIFEFIFRTRFSSPGRVSASDARRLLPGAQCRDANEADGDFKRRGEMPPLGEEEATEETRAPEKTIV